MLFLVISELDTKKNLDLMFKSNKSILKHIMYKLIANHRLPISETKTKQRKNYLETSLFTHLVGAIWCISIMQATRITNNKLKTQNINNYPKHHKQQITSCLLRTTILSHNPSRGRLFHFDAT